MTPHGSGSALALAPASEGRPFHVWAAPAPSPLMPPTCVPGSLLHLLNATVLQGSQHGALQVGEPQPISLTLSQVCAHDQAKSCPPVF